MFWVGVSKANPVFRGYEVDFAVRERRGKRSGAWWRCFLLTGVRG